MVAVGINRAYQPISEYDVGAARSAIGLVRLAGYGVPGGSVAFTADVSTSAMRRRPATRDLAEARMALLRNDFSTGTVLRADGGDRLV
ncbi:hypothetical protein [Streptomyces sp. SID13031]|uniref:hypothetical protein n=1 Tax=Streptomyces sp. SID13031 TaxID=2706046 RepID=UPI0013C875DC|nr:hypothetical protein [Streptomyces sp. SID13031]NEA34456.1 hypothetical protein [Streptomyces sp. SID13031]